MSGNTSPIAAAGSSNPVNDLDSAFVNHNVSSVTANGSSIPINDLDSAFINLKVDDANPAQLRQAIQSAREEAAFYPESIRIAEERLKVAQLHHKRDTDAYNHYLKLSSIDYNMFICIQSAASNAPTYKCDPGLLSQVYPTYTPGDLSNLSEDITAIAKIYVDLPNRQEALRKHADEIRVMRYELIEMEKAAEEATEVAEGHEAELAAYLEVSSG